MSSPSSPTVSRRWLALEMRRLRKERRLSQATVAKALGCQVPKVSLLENGQRPLHDADLKTLLELFDVPDDGRQRYFDKFRNAHEDGWWEVYDEDDVPEWLSHFIGLEQGGERISAYQPTLVHGLLQTPEYATAIYRGLVAYWSDRKIDLHVELRRRRQRMLARDVDPPSLSVIMDEAVLHRVVGNRETMQAQLMHVIDLCRSRENINVQIVPFDRGGSYEAAYGPFTVLTFPLEAYPGVVYMEQYNGVEFLESSQDIEKYVELFQKLSELALSPDDSLDMLRDTVVA